MVRYEGIAKMNRHPLVVTIAAAFIAVVAPAATAADHDAAHAQAPAKAATAHGVGIVRKVDVADGKVTLQHEAIEELGWPAMTMSFKVADPKLLNGLAPGKKVRFAFVQQGSAYVITGME